MWPNGGQEMSSRHADVWHSPCCAMAIGVVSSTEALYGPVGDDATAQWPMRAPCVMRQFVALQYWQLGGVSSRGPHFAYRQSPSSSRPAESVAAACEVWVVVCGCIGYAFGRFPRKMMCASAAVHCRAV